MHANDKALRSRKLELDAVLNHRNRDGRHGGRHGHDLSWTMEQLRYGEIEARPGVLRSMPVIEADDLVIDEPSDLRTGNPTTSHPRCWSLDDDGLHDSSSPHSF